MLRILVGLVLVLVAVSIVPTLGGGPPPSVSPRPGPTAGPATQPTAGLQTLAAPAEAPDRPRLIRLAPAAKPLSNRLLKYQLYPDALDLTPGNAATIWMRASRAAATKPKMLEEESKWLSADDTPLADFPKDKARAFLAKYANTLRLADEASRKDHCDWELPPLTVQNMGSYSLDEIQSCREIANLLSLQCRLEMSEGKFDQAIHTLQTGFALARHSGQGDTLIQNLVGIAIASVMLNRVEEMIQLPDAPNLYWALTTLPSPFVDMRPAMNAELNTIYRSFPQLRKLDALDMPPGEFEKSVNTIVDDFAKCGGGGWGSAAEAKLALTAVVLKTYPDAKRWLIAQGHKEDKVAALPALQVVLYYQLDQYNVLRDEMLAGFSLPPWQARAALDQVEKKVRSYRAEGVVNPFVLLLMPAIAKVHESDTRLQRTMAVLRAAEALRWYAGAHDGKVPDRWADMADLPTVIDPLTGRGFDAFYQVKDTTAILEVPPMPHLPAVAGRRFELKAAR